MKEDNKEKFRHYKVYRFSKIVLKLLLNKFHNNYLSKIISKAKMFLKKIRKVIWYF